MCSEKVCDFYRQKVHFRKTYIVCPWCDTHHPVCVVLNVFIEGLCFSIVLSRSPFSCRPGLSTYLVRGTLVNASVLLLKWDAIDFAYIFSWFPLTVRETLVNNLLGWKCSINKHRSGETGEKFSANIDGSEVWSTARGRAL